MSPAQPSPDGILKFDGVTSIEAGAGAAACGSGAEELQAARASAAKAIKGKGFIESLRANSCAQPRLAKARAASSAKRGADGEILQAKRRVRVRSHCGEAWGADTRTIRADDRVAPELVAHGEPKDGRASCNNAAVRRNPGAKKAALKPDRSRATKTGRMRSLLRGQESGLAIPRSKGHSSKVRPALG